MANKTITIVPADGVFTLGCKLCNITACINIPDGRMIPMVDIPIMSDEKWTDLVAQQKAQHPEYYAQAVMT